MINSPLVSVIIPVYNCRLYITEALRSVQRQSYTNLEILVCDDGSVDHSISEIEKAALLDDRIKVYVNKTNQGKVLTVNRLLEISDGDYVTILDGDDYISPDKIENQVCYLRHHEHVAACGTNINWVDLAGREIRTSHYPLQDKEIRSYIDTHTLRDFPVCCSTLLFRRTVLNEIKGYRTFFVDCCIAEDLDLVLRLLDKHMVDNLPSADYYYRFNPKSLTRRVYFSIKSRHMHEIVAYMAQQRKERGYDFLDSGDIVEYNTLIKKLSEPYIKDKGLYYRRITIEYAINRDRMRSNMYFRRMYKITGCSLSIIKIWILKTVLLTVNYTVLLRVKNILHISHLSQKV